MQSLPPIVSLIGKPNCGKTTLLERLLPELTGRGYRIGTIKHHVHRFEMDTPGKDTWRHKQAGARVVALSSPFGLGLIREVEHDSSVEELASRYFFDVDLVITEGYKQDIFPKIEVFRRTLHAEPLVRNQTWAAIVSDTTAAAPLPHFHLDDIRGIADFLVESFLRPAAGERLALLINGRHRPLENSAAESLLELITDLIAPEDGDVREITISIRHGKSRAD